MSTSEIYAVWPHMRDHARGTTPYAQSCLDKARTYQAPSKAHKKRIARVRPEGHVVKPVERDPRGCQRQRELSEARRLGEEIKRLLKKDQLK